MNMLQGEEKTEGLKAVKRIKKSDIPSDNPINLYAECSLNQITPQGLSALHSPLHQLFCILFLIAFKLLGQECTAFWKCFPINHLIELNPIDKDLSTLQRNQDKEEIFTVD